MKLKTTLALIALALALAGCQSPAPKSNPCGLPTSAVKIAQQHYNQDMQDGHWDGTTKK